MTDKVENMPRWRLLVLALLLPLLVSCGESAANPGDDAGSPAADPSAALAAAITIAAVRPRNRVWQTRGPHGFEMKPPNRAGELSPNPWLMLLQRKSMDQPPTTL